MTQVKAKNRNRMVDETPDHSLWHAATNILVLLKGMIVSGKLQSQALYW